VRVYAHDAELQAAGALPYFLATAWCFFEHLPDSGAYDFSRVSPAAIERAIRSLPASATNAWAADDDVRVLCDIECFDLVADRRRAVEQLRLALRTWRAMEPSRQLGLYSLIPERSYWGPVKRARFLKPWQRDEWAANISSVADWMERNDANALDFAASVDFWCPSPYAIEPKHDAEWHIYADGLLAEAQRMARGKPIIPILMPVYKDGGAIPLPQWASMLELMAAHPHIAGLFIWTHEQMAPDPQWREPLRQAMNATKVTT